MGSPWQQHLAARWRASSPDMHLRSVVLPQPEGPTTHTNSFSDLEVQVGDGLDGRCRRSP